MKLTNIYSIELTNKCDNACVYCPQPAQEQNGRATGFMDKDTLESALEWVNQFALNGTQSEVYLSGMGESLLHPKVYDYIKLARASLPMRVKIKLNTNGNSMTFGVARMLKDCGIDGITISDHKAKSTAVSIIVLKEVGIPFSVSRGAVLEPHNWAGQVNWHKADYTFPCTWQHNGMASVLYDGRISSCCIDAFGKGVIGHVDDAIDKVEQKPFSLCGACHHEI